MTVMKGPNIRTKANAHRRLNAGAISRVNLTMELAKYTEVSPKIHKKRFRFVGFCTAKYNPTGMKRIPMFIIDGEWISPCDPNGWSKEKTKKILEKYCIAFFS